MQDSFAFCDNWSFFYFPQLIVILKTSQKIGFLSEQNTFHLQFIFIEIFSSPVLS